MLNKNDLSPILANTSVLIIEAPTVNESVFSKFLRFMIFGYRLFYITKYTFQYILNYSKLTFVWFRFTIQKTVMKTNSPNIFLKFW
ncbi:hypothetical protein D3C85_1561610 [compost metagenome]